MLHARTVKLPPVLESANQRVPRAVLTLQVKGGPFPENSCRFLLTLFLTCATTTRTLEGAKVLKIGNPVKKSFENSTRPGVYIKVWEAVGLLRDGEWLPVKVGDAQELVRLQRSAFALRRKNVRLETRSDIPALTLYLRKKQ